MNKKATSLAKLLLITHGLVTLGYAGTLLVNPTEVAEYMGLMITTPDGTAELITMYVGMSGAMSLFMLYGAFNQEWLPQATLFLFLSMSSIALSRALSFAFLETGSYTLNALFYDIPVALLSWAAFRQIRTITRI
jgi:hypothetical protein